MERSLATTRRLLHQLERCSDRCWKAMRVTELPIRKPPKNYREIIAEPA